MILRRGPSAILLAAGAGTGTLLVLGALTSREAGWMLLGALTIVAFLAGRAPAPATGALTVGLLFVAIVASQIIDPDGDVIVPEIMLPATLFLAGLALRSHEVLAGRLAGQADELIAERDAYAHLSIRYERARIAAELHDVVAHAISMMVVQASAGQRLADRDRRRLGATFDVIATAARQAQADLDRLADLLTQEDSKSRQADLGLIREIVETARASGLPVRLRVSGDTSSVTGETAHAALRVVQEGLTNALRYAPGAVVDVDVDVRPKAVELSIVNAKSIAPPRVGLGSGRGLTGLRERLGACGGTLRAGPETDEGWGMHAWIPT